MTTNDIDYEAVPLREQSPHERPQLSSSRAKLFRIVTTKKRLPLFVVVLSVGIFVSAAINFCSMTEDQKDHLRVTAAAVISYLHPGEISPEWKPAKISLKEELHQMILDNSPAYKPKSSDAVHWTGEGDPLMLPQSEWRRWLDENPVVEGRQIRQATFRRRGCGVTMRMAFAAAADDDQQLVSAFLKYTFTQNSNHYTAEFHHREIISAYLDRVIGTNVVPPAVGHRFWYDDIQEALPGNSEKKLLAKNTHCGRTSEEFLDASVMLYLDKVTLSAKHVVKSAAQAYNVSINPKDDSELNTSAIHYAIFHYLAGCMKSDHNHFLYRSKRFIAIDNDRCFTPERLINAKGVPHKDFEQFHTWVDVLYESCQFPEHFVERLDHATREGGADDPQHRLSSQLQAALREDPLSDQLLRLQPETFDDLDRRAAKLMEHIRSCRRRQV